MSSSGMHRAFQRSMIFLFPERTVVEDELPGWFLRTILAPMGYTAPDIIWVHEISLDRGFIVIMNGSSWEVDLTGFHVCNEERRQRFDFPDGFVLPANGRVKIYCGVTAPLSPSRSAAEVELANGACLAPLTLYWEHERHEPVLNRHGDAIYVWDRYARIVTALAKCGDGASKRYTPSRLERLHNSFQNLGLLVGLLRLAFVAGGCVFGLWPLLGHLASAQARATPFSPNTPESAVSGGFDALAFGSLNLEAVLVCWVVAGGLDLAERLCAERCGPLCPPLAHSVALLGDRLNAFQLYGSLALAYDGNASLAFLGLGLLDFTTVWFLARPSSSVSPTSTHDESAATTTAAAATSTAVVKPPKFLLALALSAPHGLPALCLASEGFLVLCLVSHPVLWPTLSTAPTPPLLWSGVASRLLAAFCAARHLLQVLHLQVALATLLGGGGTAGAASYPAGGGGRGASASSYLSGSCGSSPSSPSSPSRRLGDHYSDAPAPVGSEMWAIGALVKRGRKTLTSFDGRVLSATAPVKHDSSRGGCGRAPTPAAAAALPRRQGGLDRTSQSHVTHGASIASSQSPGSSISNVESEGDESSSEGDGNDDDDDDDEGTDNVQTKPAGQSSVRRRGKRPNRSSSPVRPNLKTMRATRLTSLN